MDGYIRVSQVGGRGGERFQSPTAQRDAISGWAKAHGVRVGRYFEDLDRSGGTMDRPGMAQALQRIDSGHSEGIIVARLDRFARTVPGGLQTIYALHERGARVVSVAESIDPATPMGRAMLGLLLIMAEWVRDQADEYLEGAIARATLAGRYATKTPYGYRRTTEGTIEPHPETSEHVRWIFEQRAAGTGWRKIASLLTDRGIPNPRGDDRWAHNTVFGIVRSEAPLGAFRGPRGHHVPDAWPAIVSRELWDAANRIHGRRDNDRKHHDRLLAGIARCAGCRATLKRMVNPEGFVSYGCTRIGCDQRPSIGAHLLDGHVAALVDERLARIAVERADETDTELAPLLAARDAADREFEQWRDDTGLRGVIGDDDYRAGLIERAKARDAAAATLANYRSRTVALVPDAPEGGTVVLETLEWDDRRRVVEAYLHSVWVRKGTVRGPGAKRHVAERVRVVWMDDRDRPTLPTSQKPIYDPVPWPA